MKKICRSNSKLHAIRQKVKSRETRGVQTVIAEPSRFAFFFFFFLGTHITAVAMQERVSNLTLEN